MGGTVEAIKVVKTLQDSAGVISAIGKIGNGLTKVAQVTVAGKAIQAFGAVNQIAFVSEDAAAVTKGLNTEVATKLSALLKNQDVTAADVRKFLQDNKITGLEVKAFDVSGQFVIMAATSSGTTGAGKTKSGSANTGTGVTRETAQVVKPGQVGPDASVTVAGSNANAFADDEIAPVVQTAQNTVLQGVNLPATPATGEQVQVTDEAVKKALQEAAAKHKTELPTGEALTKLVADTKADIEKKIADMKAEQKAIDSAAVAKATQEIADA